VFALGLYDDFRPVKPAVKFAVQAAAATLLFVGGYGVFQLPLLFGSRALVAGVAADNTVGTVDHQRIQLAGRR
jgi:UDP-N-acetylmuramyl pentapeptide phosphotransferase/UDP-N-acetylglucosamine-1-phosphate transferase